MTNGVDDVVINGANGGTPTEITNPTDAPAPSWLPIILSSVSSNLMPEKFDGSNFKSWPKKLHFFLHNLNLTKYFTEVKPEVPPSNKDAHVLVSVKEWVHGDYLYKSHILHCLVNELFDVYSETNNSKYVWEALEKKYKVFNIGSSKFATANYLNYKMVDSKPFMKQLHEMQLIFQRIAGEGIKMCEMLTVNSIVQKLPPSWDDFMNYLAYKQKPLSLQNLVSRLQNKANKREKTGSEFTHAANVAEYRRKGKGKVIPNKVL